MSLVPDIGSDVKASVAGVGRRLAALSYDLLLLVAVWMAATLAMIAVRGGVAIGAGDPLLRLLLLALTALYFTGFWSRAGQTPGMRAWRIRVEQRPGESPSVRASLLRFTVGLISFVVAGLGLFWLWFDARRITWYDRAAGTQVVMTPKQSGTSR